MNQHSLPKYMVLKNQIIQWIETDYLQVGNLVPSENELTLRFGVSRHTVRQTFALLEQDGWIERIQGKGTYVKNPKTTIEIVNQSRTVGMITTYLSDYIFPHIIRGAEANLRNHGYQLIICSTDNDKQKEREALEKLIAQNLAGIIIEPTQSAQGNPNADLYQQLKDNKVPFLMINARYDGLDCPCVKVDDELGTYLATSHLFQSGHKKIAGFFKTDDLQGVERLKGFKRAFAQYHAVVEENYEICYTTEQKQNKPYEYAMQLLQKDHSIRPTAFVCYNDELAVALLEAVRKLKLTVPEDLSIVGFDDSLLAIATEVKLTTVTHPKSEIGFVASQQLIEWINQDNQHIQPEDHIFTPDLIARSSVKLC